MFEQGGVFGYRPKEAQLDVIRHRLFAQDEANRGPNIDHDFARVIRRHDVSSQSHRSDIETPMRQGRGLGIFRNQLLERLSQFGQRPG